MSIKKIILTGFLFLGFLLPGKAQKLQSYETPTQKLIYIQNSASYLVPHTARSFENAMQFHRRLWNYTPSESTAILFNDFTDYGNGGTMVIPWNMLNISVAPFDHSFGVIPSTERMQWLMEHELTHQVMCDQAARQDVFYRKILGGKVLPQAEMPLSMLYSYLTTPRWYSPRWYHEGIAVFMETWMSGGIGRVLGGYDEMVFRTMVHDSAYFYRPVGLQSEGTTIDFQVGVNAYLYGTRFISYLTKNYGTEKLLDFYRRDSKSKRFFSRQFKSVYNASLSEKWESWIAEEKANQQTILKRIAEHPVSQGRAITQNPLGSTGKAYYNAEKNLLYVPVNYPGKLAYIAAIDLATGAMHKIAPVVSPKLYSVTSMAWDKSSGNLFINNKNNDWRGLERITISTGKRKQLIRFTRTGDMVINPVDQSIWGIQTTNGRTALVRIPEPYNKIETLYTLEYTLTLFNLDISPDGKYLSATLAEVDGMEKLVLFNLSELLKGQHNYTVLFDFEDKGCSDFVFDAEGKYLYGTSYYTGVSNVFRIRVPDGDFQCITNALTGYFRPVPVNNDSLIAFRYTTGGMMPELLSAVPLENVNDIKWLGQDVYEANQEVVNWVLPPVSHVNMDSVTFKESTYHPFTQLKLASVYPILEGYKNLVGWGYHIHFMDRLAIHSLQLSASWSPYSFLPENERLHLALKWNFWKWSVLATWNKANFYDLFGPTKVSRKGYSLIASYHNYIRFHKPLTIDYKISGGMYGGLERMPGYQNITASSSELYLLMGNLHISHLRKSLGAVEPEQGFDWNVYVSGIYASNNLYPQLFTSLDAGVLLPLRNTSFWLRNAAGVSLHNDAGNSFNNYYFGGFGNNFIDYQAIGRYRNIESFPGLEINEAAGNHFIKTMGELNLRPLYFKEAGFIWLYVTYARLSLLGGGLYTMHNNWQNTGIYYNAGAQLDFDIVLFSLLKSTLSLGAARAWRPDHSSGNEFMISLKLL
ncbi:MAG: hypothetical protein WC151_02570 [Bacteroidales bacterium]|nr:hypothetical protein [Bacteroidales bacterium]MDY0285242.1 hypothetical protein [Bacteroidales bacterium]HPE87237.1 hypothetical protein [Bacteroidales bacterium]